ncbi:MAG: ATP-grasp domain-containing protein, partial [Candidatus Altiarchaeota archaeon]|nr:ATP-grasp domain-containing protein [Candidatus Altiarchaeota archaeon]
MEGLCMLKLIIDGLRREGHHVYSVMDDLKNVPYGGDDVLVPEKDMDPISFLMENVDELGVDYVYPIAPDRELGIIASKLKGEVDMICSEPDAIKTAADKWQTYKTLEEKGLRQPETFEGSCPKKNFVVKPRYGVGCEGVCISSVAGSESINQEYIRGVDASVSVFSDGRNSKAICLNKQHIIRTGNLLGYSGGFAPLSHPLRDDAFVLAE